MMRDYTRFEANLSRLQQDVYAQPPDIGHTLWGAHAIGRFLEHLGPGTVKSVLDVGCGQAVFASLFKGEPWNIEWTGVTIGEDYDVAVQFQPSVHNCDFSFLPFDDNQFDMVFARHALEHSPFPILTLMEWRRVCRKHLVVIAPAAEHWGVRGRNHYSVATQDQLKWYLLRAGWGEPVLEDHFISDHPLFHEAWKLNEIPNQHGEIPSGIMVEYRFLCEKTEEVDI